MKALVLANVRPIGLLCILGCVTAAPNFGIKARDIEEIPDLVEGDMFFPNGIDNGLIGDNYRWPNATVVYQLDPEFTPAEIQKILFGWEEIVNTTCIRFRPRMPNDTDYVFVIRGAAGSGCSSSVGRLGGRQTLNYETPSCTNRHGTVIHEMLHTLGFRHEQSRPDRDDYVEIVFEKIQPGKENNFRKYDWTQVTTFGAPYDYGSVMHYSGFGFSIDGSATIVPKIPGVDIGQRLAISQLDAGKVRLMYNCPVDS